MSSLICEFAPGFGPLDVVGPGDWVDLSSRLLEASWSEGRDDELEHYGPGQATIVLKNDDRLLDPDHASGTYFGELLPRVPFRIREDVSGTPEDRFYGFVEGGFQQNLMPPKAATCTVQLTDRLSAVAGLLPDPFDYSITSLSPDGMWVLDGPSNTEQVADKSGKGHDGKVVGDVEFNQPAVAAGHSTSAKFTADDEPAGSTFGRIELSRGLLMGTPATASTIIATFKAPQAPADLLHTLFVQGQGSVVAGTAWGKCVSLALGTNGKLHATLIDFPGQTTKLRTHSAPTVVDGKGHLVIAQSDGLALDSAVLETVSHSEGLFNVNGTGIGGLPGVNPNDHWLGWVGTVAIFNRNLNLSERNGVVTGHVKLAGLRSDEHIAWALDRIGVPAGLRNLEVGTVTMGAADTRGKDALAFIREVVATEQGEFYVDHRDGGKLRFRSRYARFTDSRSTTAQKTFSDDGASGTAVRVERSGLDVAPNGIDGIVNQADVSWRGGSLSVEDTASVVAFGPRSRTVETQATTANHARSAGEWLVARYTQPRSRVRGLTINAAASANALSAARTLRVGDRVTYRSHPQEVGSAIVIDLFVEGVTHAFSDGKHRTAAYHLAPVNTFVPWIWGTSEWDNETFWG